MHNLPHYLFAIIFIQQFIFGCPVFALQQQVSQQVIVTATVLGPGDTNFLSGSAVLPLTSRVSASKFEPIFPGPETPGLELSKISPKVTTKPSSKSDITTTTSTVTKPTTTPTQVPTTEPILEPTLNIEPTTPTSTTVPTTAPVTEPTIEPTPTTEPTLVPYVSDTGKTTKTIGQQTKTESESNEAFLWYENYWIWLTIGILIIPAIYLYFIYRKKNNMVPPRAN